MGDTAKLPKIERTAEQKAEERRIREQHRNAPVRNVPGDTISGSDAARLLKFVAALRREREAQGLSLAQLAERAGMDPAVLVRLEAGHAFNPSVSTLFRLAAALGKDLHLALDAQPAAPNT